jgi:hypothetical protein
MNSVVAANSMGQFLTRVSTLCQTRIPTRSHRTAAILSRLSDGLGFAKETPESPIPKFVSLSDWERQKSTKFDVCARVCQHLLRRDDIPDVLFLDGELKLSQMEEASEARKTRRILVYQEFSSMSGLLQNVSVRWNVVAHISNVLVLRYSVFMPCNA